MVEEVYLLVWLVFHVKTDFLGQDLVDTMTENMTFGVAIRNGDRKVNKTLWLQAVDNDLWLLTQVSRQWKLLKTIKYLSLIRTRLSN